MMHQNGYHRPGKIFYNLVSRRTSRPGTEIPMDIYSTSLATAIALSVLGAIAFVLGRWRNSRIAVQLCTVASAVAILLDFFSLIVHRLLEHSSSSSAPLSFSNFIIKHPAFLIVGLISILSLLLSVSRRTSRIQN